jgi:hypothetical protein
LQNDATRQQKFIQCLLLRQAFRAVTATPMEISTTQVTTATSGVLLRTQQQTPGTATFTLLNIFAGKNALHLTG